MQVTFFRLAALAAAGLLLAACHDDNADIKSAAIGGAGSGRTANNGPTANKAPVISGSPSLGVDTSSEYAFTPTAADPEGAKLTFTIANQPHWASFDSTTGTLRGTPVEVYVGGYPNILISVSDGYLSANLAPFSIQVNPLAAAPAPAAGGGKGTANLSWVAPTQRDDGSQLVDLAGYKVYYGQTSGRYTQVRDLADPTTTRASITELDLGAWFFAISVYDRAGLESQRSAEVSKTF